MNRELKRVSIVVLLMFVALFVASSFIQVAQADTLNADPRNRRTLYDSYSTQRGAILVEGRPIAESVPSADDYKYQRVYSDGALYAPVTGFFPISGAPTGIEAALNDKLSGTANSQFFQRIENIFTGKNPQGDSVELTLNAKAQKAAYDALGDLQGGVVLLEVKTGKVLAMASTPSFDPNVLASHDTKKALEAYDGLLAAGGDPLISRATGTLNPPGSAFKPVVAAAAISSGKYTLDTPIPNPSSYQLPGSDSVVKNDWSGTCGGGATTTILMAITLSCNIPFAEIAADLGARTIREQTQKLGFNQQLSIPLDAAKSSYPSTSDKAQVALTGFGQGQVTATALQMAMNSAAIAGGGKLMKPNLVDSIRAPDLSVVEGFTPEVLSQAMSAETAAAVTQAMVASVDHGAADNARMDGVTVAGKTGTAEHGPGQPYTLWFTGFAPADDPRYAVAVMVDNGGGVFQSGLGNTLAAPIAKKVLEAVLNK